MRSWVWPKAVHPTPTAPQRLGRVIHWASTVVAAGALVYCIKESRLVVTMDYVEEPFVVWFCQYLFTHPLDGWIWGHIASIVGLPLGVYSVGRAFRYVLSNE